jgi:hypothetical protein
MTEKQQADRCRLQAREQRQVAESTLYEGVKEKAVSSAEALEQLASRLEVSLRYTDGKTRYI